MIKNCLFAVALASLALAGGCAKGGNGVPPPPVTVDITITSPKNVNPGQIYPTLSLTLTATVANTPNTAVTWSLSGTGCSGSACGTLTQVTPPTTPATATYVAPAAAGVKPTIMATLVSDSTVTGTLPLTIVDITTDVSPVTLSVGNGLTQQFTVVAVPDNAPQTFIWTCTANGFPCATFCSGSDCVPSVASGLASYTYTPADSCSGNCVQISAVSTIDPTGCVAKPNYCTIAKASLVKYRVNGTYAFRFSGYDSSNNPIAVVGTFTAANGLITAGVEEELSLSGWAQYSITGGSYNSISPSDPNSNNAGSLTLTLPAGVYPNKYQVVLDGGGDISMIESDGQGTGSGVAQKSSNPNLFTGAQTYAFGFTGVDFGGNRVGYVGVLPMNGGTVANTAQMDVNDNGNDTNICGSGPCSISTGSYSADPSISGLYHMTLTPGAAAPMNFDFFISSGGTSKSNPLTFYAISTDPVVTHPAVSGTMVLQDSTQTYNNLAFKGTTVSALTGVNATCAAPPCTNVSLTLGTTNGNGTFSGQFDQNNAGTIVSVPSTSPFAYNYCNAATPACAAPTYTNGRYTFQMLGDPTKTPAVPPLTFVLYASGANRGFLLDQSSSSVITGTMNPQGKGSGGFAGSELPGTFAAATTSSGSSAVSPLAANLLLTSPGGAVYNVSGTQYPGTQTVTGSYKVDFGGRGTIPLTAPSAQNYVFYVLETSGCVNPSPVCAIQDFLMMDVDATVTNPSIFFAQQ